MLEFLWLHLLLVAGGLLGGLGLLLLIRDPRRRTHTLKWAIVIILAPYIGIPLYLMIGTRRISKTIRAKGLIKLTTMEHPDHEVHGVGRSVGQLLRGMDMPRLTTGHQFKLLPDGITTYEAWINRIQQAQKTIEIETYVFKMDDTGRAIRDALVEQAKAGVEVRVLIDSLGSHSTKKRFMQPLVDAGGEVSWFIPVIHNPWKASGDTRNHRKIALFDRTHVIAGGSNIGEEYIGPVEVKDRWLDLNFELQGPAVQSYFDVFRSDWAFASGRKINTPPEPTTEAVGDSLAHVLPSGVDVPGDVLYNALVTAVYEARERLWITTPYFVPDEPLTRALALAARRGIDLRIIIPDVSNQHLADLGRGSSVREIAEWGGRIIRYTGGMFHTKTVVADDSWALVGSMNTDRRSLFLNFEVMLGVYRREDVQAIAEWNERLMSPCEEGARPVTMRGRAWESMVRLLAPEL
ncbi:MAG: cardiolipin synthase [Phycisphaerae bacterium]|nr:cardiolipin synthase [Phycisphaerae bacterium]